MPKDPLESAAVDPALKSAVANLVLSTYQVQFLQTLLTNVYLQGLRDGLAQGLKGPSC